MGVFFGYDEFCFLLGWQFEHGGSHDGFDYASQASCAEFVVDGFVYDVVECFFFECECDSVHFHEFLILPDDGVFGLGEYASQCFPVERVEMGEYG